MLQTIFGVTLPLTSFPQDAETGKALSDNIMAAAVAVRDGAPAAYAAEARRDAEAYLKARRRHEIRLSPALERSCDEGARNLMRLTVSTPPLPHRADRMVA